MTIGNTFVTHTPVSERKNDKLRAMLEIHKALSDANRVRALIALSGRELCVCQIKELLQLATSTVSKHLSILKQARLVEMRKSGRWIYYRLPTPDDNPAAFNTVRSLEKSLKNDTLILEDRKRLKEILKVDTEVFCRRQ